MLSGEGGGAAGEVLDGPRADPASLWQVVLELRQVAALSGAAAPSPSSRCRGCSPSPWAPSWTGAGGRRPSRAYRKHVAVGREKQAWRLRHERGPPGGLAEGETVDVSEFFELTTAEHWITEALNANLRPIDRWLQNGEKPRTVSIAVPPDVGEVMRLHSDDRITVEVPKRLIVVLARDEDGVRVLTFYLTAPRREGGAA